MVKGLFSVVVSSVVAAFVALFSLFNGFFKFNYKDNYSVPESYSVGDATYCANDIWYFVSLIDVQSKRLSRHFYWKIVFWNLFCVHKVLFVDLPTFRTALKKFYALIPESMPQTAVPSIILLTRQKDL